MASKEEETVTTASTRREPTILRRQEPMDGSELPFLVTHWLHNFDPDAGGEEAALRQAGDAAIKRAALERIHKATSELASAFAVLGAFGSSTAPALNLRNPNGNQITRKATFADLNRRWAAAIPRNHLNNLVHAAVVSTVAAEEFANHCAESNLVHTAVEAITKQLRNPSAGRTVQDTTELDKEENDEKTITQLKPSMLHGPTHMDFQYDESQAKEKLRSSTEPPKMPALQSHVKQLQRKSSKAMRHYLDLKLKFESEACEIRTLASTIELHSKTKATLQQARLGNAATLHSAAMEISEEEQNAGRVLAQLQRKICEVVQTHAGTVDELKTAKKEAYSQYYAAKKCRLDYRDPIREAILQRPTFGKKEAQNQVILYALESRRLGLHHRLFSQRALPQMESPAAKANDIRNALIEFRLSHAVTINAHCHNPVYSVRFDRTGRYFVTGADDNLVKVFQTRGKQAIDANGKGALGQDQDRTIRGAVLVCTFRGHASVINEIDVSPDNCFLATASEDGDCRVWGLMDGAPIALLRGHAGGCNAVSWSKLTPYRLLTAGHDGYARCWDIRLAALKRYGAMVRNRPEYSLPLTPEEKASNAQLLSSQSHADEPTDAFNLPPIPDRHNQSETDGTVTLPQGREEVESSLEQASTATTLPDQMPAPPGQAPLDQGPALPLAPLPPPGAPIPDGDGNGVDGPAPGGEGNAPALDAGGQGANDIAQPGIFVQNDTMDEGVRLVHKFQHGPVTEEQIAGPSTRSGRGKVKVLLFARCPLGGHFATGASDGTCRIWEDLDDPDVETVDRRFSTSSCDWMGLNETTDPRRSSRLTTNRLLLELKGFMNPTTDLQYSHAGDRILVGSMLDGVLRIWSWDVDPCIGNAKQASTERGLRSIVIKLTNPLKTNSGSTKNTRRRARGSAASTVSKILLDMAVWAHDDSKIITSQSQPLSGLKIEPGSNFIFLWDSRTGHCLLGIAGAHSRATPVILPHPTNVSIFCSGGSDGYVKVWDCETGKCLFSHRNEHQLRYLLDATPQEPCGLLNDGAFFPDGTGFVLSDSSGNVLIFDSIIPSFEHQSFSQSLPPPPNWMTEQYRANDYYDLKYEVNGYCVEQGSHLPPHLAPRGVRCTHAGAPFPDYVTEAFQNLAGPEPMPVEDSQWFRQSIRCRAQAHVQELSAMPIRCRRGNIMQEFDPLVTVLVRGTGEVITTRSDNGEVITPTSLVTAVTAAHSVSSPAGNNSSDQRRSSNSGRLLSSNYRWRDYSDMLAEERLYEEDSDDEEFQPTARSRTGRSASGQVESYDESDDEIELEPPRRRPAQRASQRTTQLPVQRQPTRRIVEVEGQRPSRHSNRRKTGRKYQEADSDDDTEFVTEFLSTNNDPSGAHVDDYSKHFFRLTANGPPIARQWLRRLSSDAGYQGRKTYAPQVGDTVVYIPRAHFEWISAFPSLNAPWQHWPPEAEWPVVCCRIRDVRYRFPFMDYYGNRNSNRNKCNSVVAILCLDVTGIPVLSTERDFNWPDPQFIPPAKSHLFELDLFESVYEEFLIPFDRYVWRLQCLEEAVINNHGTTEGIEISAYYEGEENESVDSDLKLYRGQLDEYAQRTHSFPCENLNNCGYGAVRIRWPDDNHHDTLSPWEVIVEKPKSRKLSLSRHCLDDNDKKRATEALKKLKRIPSVREQLMYPVDERRYIDYSVRVEIPICLEFVEHRLMNNYYSNRWSIVADVKLIRDNCIKYNGEVGLLPDEARQMYDEFEKDMLSDEERRLYNDLRTMVKLNSQAQETSGSRSTLENIPSRETDDGTSRRRSLRIRIDASQVHAAEATTGRTLRSNSQGADIPNEAVHSLAFANTLQNLLRRRQSSRLSNGSDSVTSGRGLASAPSAAERPVQRSSRVRGAQPDAPVEVLATTSIRVQRRRSQANLTRPLAAARRQARSRSAQEESASESESDAKPPARATRNSTRIAVKHVESMESRAEHKPVPQPSRRSVRPSKAVAQHEVHEKSLSSGKTKARKRKASDELDEFEGSESLSVEEDSEGGRLERESQSGCDSEAPPLAPTPMKLSSGRNASRTRTATRRKTGWSSPPALAPAQKRLPRRGNRVSYTENSESEFEEHPTEDDISAHGEVSSQKRPSRSRRAEKKLRPAKKAFKGKKTSPRAKHLNKRKREESESEDSERGEEFAMSPRTSCVRTRRTHPWPDIDRRKITTVTRQMLTYLRGMDDDKVFENPVIETVPEIKDEYLQVVSRPMDFRTIEEGRINYYRTIQEFQEDLTLIFQNCIRFNGEMSEYGQFAQQMLDMLDGAYENVVG